jgi:hypothetical protein
MGAWFDGLTIHAWYCMQTWRVASSARKAWGAERCKVGGPFLPWSEDVLATTWLHLPPGALFAGRLGLDLGITPDLARGARRHL